MKTKMIVKFNSFLSYENAQKIKCDLLYQWHNNEIIACNKHVEILAIILEDEKGEIKVINLKESSVKNKENILEKIKKLFKKKNKS